MVAVSYAIACLIAVAVVARTLEGAWLAPGAVFAGYWAFWICAAATFGSGFRVPPAGPTYITAAAVAVATGSYLGTGERLGRSGQNDLVNGIVPTPAGRLSALGGIGAAGGCSGLLATLLIFSKSGFSASALTSQTGLFQVGNALAVQRYSGDQQSLGAVPLLLAVTYAGALAAPFLLAAPKSDRSRWSSPLLLSPLAGALVFSVITTARLPMLLAVCFTAVSAIVATSMRQGQLVRLRARHAVVLATSAVAVTIAFLFIAFIRIGPASGSEGSAVLGGFRVYTIGYVSSFSQWLDQPTMNAAQSNGSPAMGASTFGAVARELGMNPSLSEAYPDFRPLGRGTGESTNIYTAFRAGIVDFGVPGSLLFYAAIGFVGARARTAAIARRSPLAAMALVVVYSYFLNSNSQSIFWFTNVCLAIVLAAFCLSWTFGSRSARHPLESSSH